MRSQTRDVFAILTGGYVEFRAAHDPPVAKTSKLTKTITVPKGEVYSKWDPYFGEFLNVIATRAIKKKIELEQTHFVGGTVIGYMKVTRYRRMFGDIQKGALRKLSPSHRDLLLDSNWRRKNL